MTQTYDPSTAATPGPSTPGLGHTQEQHLDALGRYEWGWADSDVAGAAAKRGLTPEIVADISGLKSEPQWMLDLRLKGHKLFQRKPMPTWGAELGDIDFDNIKYFVRSTEKQATSWEDLPADIKNTYTSWASRRRRRPGWLPAWRLSTSRRWSTTRSTRNSRSRA